MDAEKGRGKELATAYRDTGYPTVLFLDETGKEVDRIVGYLPMPEFLERLKSYADGTGTVAGMEKALSVTPDDFALRYRLAEKFFAREEPEKALPHLRKLSSAQAVPDSLRSQALHLQALLEAQLYHQTAALDTFVTRYQERDYFVQALGQIISTLLRQNWKSQELYPYLDVLVRRAPHEAQVWNLYAWVLVQNRERLEEAREMAEKAVEYSNGAPQTLDTLAEIYFLQGNREQALATERRAAALAPTQNYYRRQIAKFSQEEVK